MYVTLKCLFLAGSSRGGRSPDSCSGELSRAEAARPFASVAGCCVNFLTCFLGRWQERNQAAPLPVTFASSQTLLVTVLLHRQPRSLFHFYKPSRRNSPAFLQATNLLSKSF